MFFPKHFVAVFALLLLTQPLVAQEPKVSPPPAGVKSERDVEYGKGGDETLRLDIAWPESLADRAPCVVVIHGGAWRAGNKAGHADLIYKFAQAGYVSASLQYRFCPKHQFPAQVEDVKCAVRFLRANAERLHIDPARFGAVGFSAGAHLSMMLGVTNEKDGLEGNGGWPDQSSQVQAVVAFFGPTDFAAIDLPAATVPLVKDFIGGTAQEKPDAYAQASPVTHVSAGDAPLLIFQGTKDPLVPHTQAYKMADALTAVGVPGRVELFLGVGHGWGGELLDHTVKETFQFFDQKLKPVGAIKK